MSTGSRLFTKSQPHSEAYYDSPIAERATGYLRKAGESLEGAASENSSERYQNAVNRSYYATFQAAVHALLKAGFEPPADHLTWPHRTVQALFSGELINRRKLYPPELRAIVQSNYLARQAADYSDDFVSAAQSDRAYRRARQFVETVAGGPV